MRESSVERAVLRESAAGDAEWVEKNILCQKIDPMSFAGGMYDADDIRRDEQKAFRLEHQWEQNERERRASPDKNIRDAAEYADTTKKLANALEILIAKHGEDGDWFASKKVADTKVRRAAKPDDYFHGADVVMSFPEVREEKKPLVFSLDVTVDNRVYKKTEGRHGVEGKVRDNFKKMLGEKDPATVKYFPEEMGKGFDGTTIPLVVGLSAEKATDLFSDERGKDGAKKVALSPAQTTFLREMKIQLQMYEVVLSIRSFSDENSPVLETVERGLEIIDALLAGKPDRELFDPNGVYLRVLESCNKIYHEYMDELDATEKALFQKEFLARKKQKKR